MKNDSYNILKKCVASSLEKLKPSLEDVACGEEQFLLLSTNSDFAGFVVLNGSPEATYRSSYARFKEIYREAHDEVKSKTLSFVLCHTDTRRDYESFYGAIESDVYFCRKYVIRFHKSAGPLLEQLSGLAFFPLPEGGVSSDIMRPPSAQTLLQNIGVSASMSKNLVVPGEYSAKRFVEDIQTGSTSLPEIGVYEGKQDSPGSTELANTRLSKLNIESFRAYNKGQDFDLDADVIVLYGPNGLGKTSFFDAIDFACTGRIFRFSGSQSDFVKIARNLNCDEGSGQVRLEVKSDSGEHAIVRAVDDWSSALIGDDRLKRVDILQLLSAARWQDKAPRVENLEKLFRSTHLFNQTDQQMMSMFRTESTIPFDVLSRMLALDDYATGLTKVEEVSRLVGSKIAAKNDEIRTLMKEVSDLEQRLALFENQGASELPSSIDRLIAEVEKDVKKLGVDVFETTPNLDLVRGWRSLGEAKIDALREKIRTADTLMNGFSDFQKNRELSVKISGDINQTQIAFRDTKEELAKSDEAYQGALTRLETSKEKVSDAEQKLDKLKAVNEAIERIAEIVEQRTKYKTELSRLASMEKGASLALKEATEKGSEASANLRESTSKLESLSRRSNLYLDLLNRQPKWEHLKSISNSMLANEKVAEREYTDLQAKLKDLRSSTKEHEQQLAQAAESYEIHCKNKDDLNYLLDRIETFINDSKCPLCGVDHNTEDSLLENIRSQKTRQPNEIQKLAEARTNLTSKVKHSKEKIDRLEVEVSKAKIAFEESAKDAADGLKYVRAFENQARELGFDPDNHKIKEHVNAAIDETESETKRLQIEVGNLKTRHTELKTSQLSQEGKIKELSKQKTAKQKEIDSLDRDDKTNRTVIINAGFSSEISKEEVAQHVKQCNEAIKGITEQMQSDAKMVENTKRLRKKCSEIHLAHQRKLKNLEAARQECLQNLTKITADLAKLDLCPDTSKISLDQRMTELRNSEKDLDGLVAKLRLVETTLDAATRTAAESEMRASLKGAQKKLSNAQKESERLRAGEIFARKIVDQLKRKSSSAIDDHISAYGPLTTIIQKRLRSVYGFGGIRLERGSGDDIKVEVEWKDDSVRPIDYFSDSQKQILMLSIFLAGRLTQTWSGFAPILMDDPVTHFDDLNCYAFVELIRGILQSQPGGRQFIISTCEERLFRLMREKFSENPGGSRFYEFHCLTDSGPEIEAVG
jgi:exonuclease SbcC